MQPVEYFRNKMGLKNAYSIGRSFDMVIVTFLTSTAFHYAYNICIMPF
jgi:hypothetical protein